jgi:hypothetical protein
METHKKLDLTNEQKENLPLFYEFIMYNDMVDHRPDFSRDLLFFTVEDHNTSFPYMGSAKPISKIIDYSQIRQRLPGKHKSKKQ